MSRKKTEPDASKPALVQTYQMHAEAVFIPTISRSLMESISGDLPVEEEPQELVTVVKKQPGLYSTFLGKIIAGSSFRTAALSVGFSPQRVRLWLQQGSADLGDDYDTYYSRLLLDCQRAASIAVSDAEERVHRADPAKWLSRSPTGKEFNKGKYWTEQIRTLGEEIPDEEENTFDPPPLRPAITQAGDQDDTGNESLKEALKVLEDLGIASSPELVKQAKQQFRITE